MTSIITVSELMRIVFWVYLAGIATPFIVEALRKKPKEKPPLQCLKRSLSALVVPVRSDTNGT